MRLEIMGVHNRGDAGVGPVRPRAFRSRDFERFLLADTTYTARRRVPRRARHSFRPPDREIEAGDVTGPRTGRGLDRRSAMAGVETRQLLQCELDHAVWNDADDGDVPFAVRARRTTPVEPDRSDAKRGNS